MKETLETQLTVNWRYFSLEQVNSDKGPGWKIWEQDEDYPSKGLLAFKTAEAARRQGEESFYSFHMALLKARHEQGMDITDVQAILRLAESLELDIQRFKKDLNGLNILVVPIVLAEDRKPISGDRIEQGEIDEEGKVMKK